MLEMLHRNGHIYQSKGKNKLMRGINLKLQKNKVNFEPDHMYKTIRMLLEMKFPTSTLLRVMYKIVLENEVDKRLLYQI